MTTTWPSLTPRTVRAHVSDLVRDAGGLDVFDPATARTLRLITTAGLNEGDQQCEVRSRPSAPPSSSSPAATQAT